MYSHYQTPCTSQEQTFHNNALLAVQASHEDETEEEIKTNHPPPTNINDWDNIHHQNMNITSNWTEELDQQTDTETYLNNQQNIQRLDLTNPETYNETQTKEEKEEPQTQYEEQLSRYQELTLIGVNSIIQTNKDDHKIANNIIKKEITKRYHIPGSNQELGI